MQQRADAGEAGKAGFVAEAAWVAAGDDQLRGADRLDAGLGEQLGRDREQEVV